MSSKTELTAETSMEPAEDLDPVTFEVIRHRLWAINDDQARMAARLSGAPIIFEGYDFNAALISRDGRGLYCGVYIMQHGATIDGFVRQVVDEWPKDDIREGDMFFTNDPWNGALHAPDAILVMPIFWDGQIVAWSGIVMHDNDTGGAAPGSMVLTADDRFAESPLFPLVRMAENFDIRHDMERLYLRNSRSPELNRLNMRARVGALRVTHERVVQLVERYGIKQFCQAQDGIIDYVDRVVRTRLRNIPDGSWFASGYVDHDGKNPDSYQLCCRLTKEGDHLTFDFTGTAAQAPGPVNCTFPATEGSVFGVVLASLCYDLPWAIGGLHDVVSIVSEPGTLNNATSPAPVSAASVSSVLVTTDVAGLAFSRMLLSSPEFRDEAHATWMPSFSGGFFSSLVEQGELGLVALADMFGGGGGARRHSDGIDSGGIAHSMASRMCNVETIEARAPVLQLYRREIADGGGPGRYRGGAGIEFGNVAHKAGPGLFMTFASGVLLPGGRGLSGGLPGAAASSILMRNSDIRRQFADGHMPTTQDAVTSPTVEVLPAKSITVVDVDDLLITVVGSGSGYGDPLLREPAAVVRDVEEKLVTIESARAAYGVVLDHGRLDIEETAKLREMLRKERLANALPISSDHAGGVVHPATLLHPVSDAVEAVRGSDDRARFRCTECRGDLGSYDADYRSAAFVRQIELSDLSSHNALCDSRFVARQFLCPSCGASLSVDVQDRDEPLLGETVFGAGRQVADRLTSVDFGAK